MYTLRQNGNLFPTVRTRRPTEQRVYLSTKRVCLPTYLPIDRPTDRPTSFLTDTKLRILRGTKSVNTKTSAMHWLR
ncbi:hypothetical protein V2W45_1415861 [Cenococcum geophilum]